MLRTVIPITCLICASVVGHTQSEGAIRELLSAQQKAWNAGDIERFMQGYIVDEDLHFLGESGLVSGWQQILARYHRRYPDRQAMGKLKFTLEKITKRTEDVYTVVGQYHVDRSGLENLEGYFLLVLVQADSGWKIVADSTH